MRPTPLQLVKERHGSKSDLVNKLAGLIDPESGETPEAHKKRLLNVSNAKLLHLFDMSERVKAAGGREGLVKKVLELKGQPKDHEYADALNNRTLGYLLDLYTSLQRRASRQ